MSQTTETTELEVEIAALIKQAGESLRREHDDCATASTAPSLQPALDGTSQQENRQ
jgi:hypothetical protein